MKKMNPVIHFEMPYKNNKRMSDFYGNTFGWKTQNLGEEMGNYVLAMTKEDDKEKSKTQTSEQNECSKYGAINGGFYERKDGWPDQYPSIVISVDDIKDSMKKVAKAGGQVLGEPMEIPGVGMYVSFMDTEGNRVSMLQPKSEK